ncbi:tRNA epoxyqueuosine(34) reductase QueG [Gilvimarinus sp. DA14]|uniref:tRNA epoxyqueuosine(34) reductase QueG n=1 Tax=Gilvimarinus sp. DA14 TaxID=2956798 RepID=UPI0020B6CAAC|nr:tRNA epoxyqueuosine(34) reductase QueG [Gilvimarinus sp. DA14]UTF61623.1 tRNA epoxyqueuosine(34) reductase QueG [Gilvimarinus sp. DA14]
MSSFDFHQLARDIKRWGRELGFQQVGITDVELSEQEQKLKQWLAKGYHGEMLWLGEHGNKRSRPTELVPGTARVISVRMDYLPGDTAQIKVLKDADKAYVSRYALGRDYHKLIRKRLAALAKQIEAVLPEEFKPKGERQMRPFVDSAPVMERPLADKAGLGWTGKHTLILNDSAGSWFFLGELFTYLPLPIDKSEQPNRCGECTACLKVCPTDAFPEPYTLDARRCISYLTIELKGAIPEEFREPIGNRVFGCDDCQAICPWNKYAKPTCETDFLPRHGLDNSDLLTLFKWSEAEFLKNTEGSAIRRVGYERWLRNLAIGLGNAPSRPDIIDALQQRLGQHGELVDEHIEWALAQQAHPNRRRKRKIKHREANTR